jgi:hypothetical protein
VALAVCCAGAVSGIAGRAEQRRRCARRRAKQRRGQLGERRCAHGSEVEDGCRADCAGAGLRLGAWGGGEELVRPGDAGRSMRAGAGHSGALPDLGGAGASKAAGPALAGRLGLAGLRSGFSRFGLF